MGLLIFKRYPSKSLEPRIHCQMQHGTSQFPRVSVKIHIGAGDWPNRGSRFWVAVNENTLTLFFSFFPLEFHLILLFLASKAPLPLVNMYTVLQCGVLGQNDPF